MMSSDVQRWILGTVDRFNSATYKCNSQTSMHGTYPPGTAFVFDHDLLICSDRAYAPDRDALYTCVYLNTIPVGTVQQLCRNKVREACGLRNVCIQTYCIFMICQVYSITIYHRFWLIEHEHVRWQCAERAAGV
jgi:hypothetical protein